MSTRSHSAKSSASSADLCESAAPPLGCRLLPRNGRTGMTSGTCTGGWTTSGTGEVSRTSDEAADGVATLAVGVDARPSVGVETRPSTGIDARPSVGVETRPNAGVDACPSVGCPSVGVETRPNAGVDACPSVGCPSVGVETRPNAGVDACPSVGVETRPNAGVDACPSVGVETRPNAGVDVLANVGDIEREVMSWAVDVDDANDDVSVAVSGRFSEMDDCMLM